MHILDFSHAPYPDHLFLNTGHLNYDGARTFSAELRARLLADGVDLGGARAPEDRGDTW